MAISEEAAVLAVIERRRKAFAEHDFETYASLHVHEPFVSWWHGSPVTGNFVRNGWDETAPLLRQWMAASEKDTRGADDGIIENRVVRVSDTMAWVTFTRRYPDVPAHRAGPNAAHQLRILEKHDGEWKIVLAGFLDPSVGGEARSSVMRLDPRGKILWKSAAGETALAADEHLLVRNGKLHVRNSEADRNLYAAIRWAEELAKEFIPRRGSLPIVLDVGEGSPAKVWWVIGDAGAILFSLGEPGREERQLDAVAVIFRLSAAQRAVAGHVIAGRSLEEAAGLMGIKESSARTHLDRVFEKTGVRNKGALIRVLLSIATPV